MEIPGDGLLYAYILDERGGGTKLDWEGVKSWKPGDGVIWIHLDFTNETAQHWLTEESGLDDLVADSLVADETRPRCDAVDGGLLVSLRGVNVNPGADPEDMVAIRLYTDGEKIISTRRRRLMSARDLAEKLDDGRGPDNAGEFLAALSYQLVERMSGVIQDIEDRIDELEERIIQGNGGHDLRMQLLDLRREAILLRRYLGPQREAMNRLQMETMEWLRHQDRMRLREVSDHISRYVEDLDAVRDRGGVAAEELVSRLSEQMNSRMYLLSMIAGVFLPLGFLTGLLGINVGGIPAADKPWGFIAVVVLLILIAVLQLFYFKRKSWL